MAQSDIDALTAQVNSAVQALTSYVPAGGSNAPVPQEDFSALQAAVAGLSSVVQTKFTTTSVPPTPTPVDTGSAPSAPAS